MIHPPMNDAGILSRRYMPLTAQAAREKVSASARRMYEPIQDCRSGLFGDLELDRPAGLPLDDRRPVLHAVPDTYIANPEYEVAAPELTVDRKVEQREVAFALFKLEPMRIAQTSLGLSGRF